MLVEREQTYEIETPDRLILGIDFGTTFSGVAYSYSANPDQPDDINIIQTWPGSSTGASDKVASEIAYGPSEVVSRTPSVSSIGQRAAVNPAQPWRSRSTASGRSAADVFNFARLNSALNNAARSQESSTGLIRWGSQLREDETRLRCMKLFLESNVQLPSYVSEIEMRALLRQHEKDPETVVADYLTELFKHAKQTLVMRYGEYFIRTTRLEVILTVPAIWSDAAQNATLQAAQTAGMGGNIRMISEPEAAAVYTIKAIQPNHLNVGDNVIVCDAGGGTVDLISYEIRQINPLRIRECVKGTGALCGSVLLNVKFEDYVRTKLGPEVFQDICSRQPRTWLHAARYFETYVKRQYDPTNPTQFHIPFPGVPDNVDAGVYQGFMTMSSEAVGALFKPIIDQIIRLIEEQMERLRDLGKSISSLVLVGGFGQSICLYRCLSERFANFESPPPYPGSPSPYSRARDSHQGFEIMQPPNAWTAVARGAVLRGLEGAEIVLSRKSRRHYGVRTRHDFDPAVDRACDKFWDKYKLKWRTDKGVRWFIGKGETCLSSEPILFSFHNSHDTTTGNATDCDLVVCDEDEAPDTTSADNVERICRLRVNLDPIPQRFWRDRVNSEGLAYKDIDFFLGMTVESGGLRFDLRVDGVVYGELVADFSYS